MWGFDVIFWKEALGKKTIKKVISNYSIYFIAGLLCNVHVAQKEMCNTNRKQNKIYDNGETHILFHFYFFILCLYHYVLIHYAIDNQLIQSYYSLKTYQFRYCYMQTYLDKYSLKP